MMYFGWRPIQSCYGNTGTADAVNAANTVTACAQPIWFYVLLSAALIGGAMHGKGKQK